MIRFKLEDGRFCNSVSWNSDDCPCLQTDDFYGDPESCRLGYEFKITFYNSQDKRFRDDVEAKPKTSGYPYGYEKVAVRPADCIKALGGDSDAED